MVDTSPKIFVPSPAARIRCLIEDPVRVFLWVFLGFFFIVRSGATIHCPDQFSDHMVLQRDVPVPIWGTATAGQVVTVAFAGQIKEATAGSDGRWEVALDPLLASAEPRTVTIRGADQTLRFDDVLVGEVWFCSGQSNMEKSFFGGPGQKPVDNFELEVAAAHFPSLRLFKIPRTDKPQAGPGVTTWLRCSPAALRESEFSAAAYFFGQQIHQTLNVPVGLMLSSLGGTSIDAWMPRSVYADSFAGADGKGGKFAHASELFEGMVAPYAPFAVRGFLWYQGERNLGNGDVEHYAEKQAALIEAWRQAWRRPDAPFFGVLLVPMKYSNASRKLVTAEALPLFWQQQVKALSAPRTGFVVTTDLVSDFHDIHPTNKRDVGLRLARLALAETYGYSDITARGPTFRGMSIEGREIVINLDHAAGLRARDGEPLTDFSIADRRREFRPATARIEDNRVVVSSDDLAEPVAVRFAWSESAHPNLINGAGLPAVPFRTDDWPVSYRRIDPNDTN